MAFFNDVESRLRRASETASRTDTRPHQGYRSDAQLSYSIRTPKPTFDSLDDDDRERYTLAVSAAANGDSDAASIARTLLDCASADIAETRRIAGIDCRLSYEVARLTAASAVRGALPTRANKKRYEFLADVNVETTAFEEGTIVGGDELPAGTIKSLLSGGFAKEL